MGEGTPTKPVSLQKQLLQIERRLEEKRQRGHVYLPAGGPVVVTTAEQGQGTSKIIGPAPAMKAIRAVVGRDFRRWTGELKTRTSSSDRLPPVVWNTAHLVVTGTTTTHALLMALHHPSEYDEHELDELRATARGDALELEQAFDKATGGTLPPRAQSWLRLERGQRQAAKEVKTSTGGSPQEGETMLTRLAERTRGNPHERNTLRIMMRGITRTWKALNESERELTLAVPPCLSGTKWDALLAAVTEHVAWLTGYPTPAWAEEPARFNEPPQSYSMIEKENAICWCPGAFLRHGALADPRDLDARGGEHGDWIPRTERRN